MHKVVPQIEKNISIPILHIADSTGKALVKDGKKKSCANRYKIYYDRRVL